ncbi:unnamed protein product [Calicophoron daubneyi]|uniref:G-protein coupled receptors family 1 profile domain-containing protein n=1 Tax=Calicophoron daubneyi TaxID=300641 RepID=A0AAV2TPY5_CALDB
MILLDAHFFWTMTYSEIRHDSGVHFECVGCHFTQNIFPYIDLLLACVLPFTLMLIANGFIGSQLKKVREFGRRRHMPATQPLNIPPCDSVAHDSVPSMGVSCVYVGCRGAKSQKRFCRHEVKDSIKVKTSLEKSSALTTMLVAISVFFMISVSPLLVYDVLYFALDINKWVGHDEVHRGVIMFGIERFVYTLWYSNFAVHFILYCFNGPQFRAKALELFCSECQHQRPILNTSVNGKSVLGPEQQMRCPRICLHPPMSKDAEGKQRGKPVSDAIYSSPQNELCPNRAACALTTGILPTVNFDCELPLEMEASDTTAEPCAIQSHI